MPAVWFPELVSFLTEIAHDQERLHLQIFEDEVVRSMLLVDGVLNRESITYVHTLLLGKGIQTLVFRNRLIRAHHHLVESDTIGNWGVAIATHHG